MRQLIFSELLFILAGSGRGCERAVCTCCSSVVHCSLSWCEVVRFVEKIGYVVPDLVKINIKDHLLYGKEISQGYLTSAFVYILVYIILVCFITSIVFKRKDLN